MNEAFIADYRQALDSLHYTPEQISHLAQAAARAQARKPRRAGRVALIAAAIAAVLVGTASATGAISVLADMFAPFFGYSDTQRAYIETHSYAPGVSATDNGVTVALDAVLCDNNNVTLLLSIRRDDGMPLVPEGVSDDLWHFEENFSRIPCDGGAGSVAQMKRMDDGSLQYAENFTPLGALREGAAATVHIKNIWFGPWSVDDSGKRVPDDGTYVLEGCWEFTFPLRFTDSSVILEAGDTKTIPGAAEVYDCGTLTLSDTVRTMDEIRVSPLSVALRFTTVTDVTWDGATEDIEHIDSRFFNELSDIEIRINKTDGSSFRLTAGSSAAELEDDFTPPQSTVTAHHTKIGRYQNIIPLEEIESITVDGVVYPLPQD